MFPVHLVLSFLPSSAGLPQTFNLAHDGQATDIPSTCSSCKWSQVTQYYGAHGNMKTEVSLGSHYAETQRSCDMMTLSPWSASHWFCDFWRSKSQVSKDVKLYNKMSMWVHCDKRVPHKTVGTIWGNIWQIIYLWRKVVCFVLFVLMRSTKLGCFRSHSWSLWKALEEEGCMGLVSWRLDLRCKSSWILNDFFNENEIKS